MATVLIIDEDHINIQKQFESEKGIFSHSFLSVSEAIETIRNEQFDIVVCLITVGLENAETLTAELSKHQPSETKLFWLRPVATSDFNKSILGLRESVVINKPVNLSSIGLDKVDLFNQEDIDALL